MLFKLKGISKFTGLFRFKTNVLNILIWNNIESNWEDTNENWEKL